MYSLELNKVLRIYTDIGSTHDFKMFKKSKIYKIQSVQEANSKSQIVTAKGNVQLVYPARKIQARANVAQYFIKEKKVILTGNVYVIQKGNSLQGESITYLIDEGRFFATPKTNKQVTSIYIVPDNNGGETEN